MRLQLAQAEALYQCLYDIRWHANSQPLEVVRSWLQALATRLAPQCPLTVLQECMQRACVSATTLVRFLKSSDPDTVDLASVAIAYLSGQGTHVNYHRYSSGDAAGVLDTVEVAIVEGSFAGSHETLGNKLWPSALRLADMCWEAREWLRPNRPRVLEIGCGPALPGILCALVGCGRVVLTDYVDSVLSNAQVNVERNLLTDTTVVRKLDWTAPPLPEDPDLGPHQFFDLILAADIIYEEWHAAATTRIIGRYLRPGGQCWVVLGDRQARRGIELFEQQMASAGMLTSVSVCTNLQSEYVFHRPANMTLSF